MKKSKRGIDPEFVLLEIVCSWQELIEVTKMTLNYLKKFSVTLSDGRVFLLSIRQVSNDLHYLGWQRPRCHSNTGCDKRSFRTSFEVASRSLPTL